MLLRLGLGELGITSGRPETGKVYLSGFFDSRVLPRSGILVRAACCIAFSCVDCADDVSSLLSYLSRYRLVAGGTTNVWP